MENGGAFYVVRQSDSKTTFRPNVIFTGDATSFVRDPPLVGIEILPNSFITKVIFPAQGRNLSNKVNILIERPKTMKIVGSFKPPEPELNVYSSPRIRRVRPSARFSATFDFPAPVVESAAAATAAAGPRLSARRLPNGTIQINVPRPAGDVDLRRYRCIRI